MKETRKPQPLLTGMNVCMFGCEWVCKGCILMQSSFFYCTTKCSQFWSRYFVLNVKASMSLFLILIKDFLLTKTPRREEHKKAFQSQSWIMMCYKSNILWKILYSHVPFFFQFLWLRDIWSDAVTVWFSINWNNV